MSNVTDQINFRVIEKYLLRYSQSLRYVSENHLNLTLRIQDVEQPIELGYVCPLCLEKYFVVIDSKCYRNSDFSEDHYPPQCVGGKRKVLVCRDCNSTAGFKYDYAIKSYLEALSFLKGHPHAKLPIKSKFPNVKGNYTSSLVMRPDKAIIHEYTSKHSPFLKNWMEGVRGQSKWEINLTFTAPTEELLGKALLRSAYLYFFGVFGYGFAYSYVAKYIREMLSGVAQHPLSNMGVLIYDEKMQYRPGLSLIQTPKEYRSYVLNMPLMLKQCNYKAIASILIPLGHNKDFNSLSIFKNVIGSKSLKCTLNEVDEEQLYKGNYNAFCSTHD